MFPMIPYGGYWRWSFTLGDLDFSKYTHVWILLNYTDMRQGIEKFAAIIQFQLHLDAYDERSPFLF